jgi:hypothetical protein
MSSSVSDPTPPDSATWEYLVGGFVALGGIVAAAAKRSKRLAIGAEPDYESMARAFFAEKEEADERHRNAIIDALDRVSATVRAVNETTTENIRRVLMEYGRDVTQIKSAQEQIGRDIHETRKLVDDIRLQQAREGK